MVHSMPLGPCALKTNKGKMPPLPQQRPQNRSARRAAAPSRFAVAVSTAPANTVRSRRRYPQAGNTGAAIYANRAARRPMVRVGKQQVTSALAVAVLLGMLCAMGWRALTAAAPVSPASSSTAVMTVQSGDTLWSLAQRHGNARAYILDRVDALARANNLSPDARLVPGQKLIVPAANPQRVAKADSGAAAAQP